MALHINDIRDSAIPKVSKDEFYSRLVWGDLIFCSGEAAISKGIEVVTGSPFSHVLMAWLPANADQWLTLEATIDRGVHVGRLSDYTDSYDGDLVMARRMVIEPEAIVKIATPLTDAEKFAQINRGFSVLECAYDWQQEVSIVARKLCDVLPLVKPKREYYCSGLQYLISQATPFPLQRPGANMPTPEDNWTDPTVTAICAFLRP